MRAFTVRLVKISAGMEPRGWLAEIGASGLAGVEALVTVPAAVWEALIDRFRNERGAMAMVQRAAERWLAGHTLSERIPLQADDFAGLEPA